jgi:hypothetical protein
LFEIVIEESPAGEHQTYPERTRAIFENEEVIIVYEYLEEEEWKAWEDVGCHIPENALLLLAGILENKAKIMKAAGEK